MKNMRQIMAFAIGTGAQAAFGFLSVPLLVRALGAHELGRWSVIEATFQFSAQVALLGFNQTIIKFVANDGFAAWPSMRMIARAVAPAALTVSLLAGIAGFYWLSLPAMSVAALMVLVILEAWMVLGLSTARAASLAVVFSGALIARGGIILLVLSAATLVMPGLVTVAADVVWLWIVTYSVAGTMLALAVRGTGHQGSSPARENLLDGARYGLPLLGALLLAQALQYADRLVVSSQLGFAEAGKYFIHARVANTMTLAALPIQLWWPTARFTHLKDGDRGARFFASSSLLGVGYFSLMMLLVALIGPLVFRWFAPNERIDIWLFLCLLGAQYLLVSSVFFNIGLLDQGTTHLNTMIWGVTALVQILAQWLLAQRAGLLGVGAGTLLGASCALGFQYALSQKRRFVAFPRGAIALLMFATIFAAAASLRGLA